MVLLLDRVFDLLPTPSSYGRWLLPLRIIVESRFTLLVSISVLELGQGIRDGVIRLDCQRVEEAASGNFNFNACVANAKAELNFLELDKANPVDRLNMAFLAVSTVVNLVTLLWCSSLATHAYASATAVSFSMQISGYAPSDRQLVACLLAGSSSRLLAGSSSRA